ncbi:ABC transporter substrate-binding protein [Litorivita sp. NS0012-18]|uniref:ABC transporter substrate-binding protein n=1 Tax=Litorivita sp. NS0012-18 TaxID=3127655 RepID=UPI00310B99AB
MRLRLRIWLVLLGGLGLFGAPTQTLAQTSAKEGPHLAVTYLSARPAPPPTLSNLDPVPEDLGRAGAELARADNATTGRFLNHHYALETVTVSPENGVEAARAALSASPYLIIDAAPDLLLQIADLPEAKGAILFNVGAPDPALRSAKCRSNLLHTAASYAMRADALSQFLVSKRWGKTALIAGPAPQDQAFAAAIEASLAKFGLRAGKRADWSADADMRRTASQEVPLFTQALGDHDVLIVADEANDFARYVVYNTWLARPVAGSVGLRPAAWGRVVEQWGAAQLQSRFRDLAGRDMQPRDYAAWAAMRSLGEAMTRVNSAQIETLRAYILSDTFELAGFKGRPLSYRAWNGQLRQPIPLLHDDAVVANAPLDGFLHQNNELDSLGLDRPESACTAFEGE